MQENQAIVIKILNMVLDKGADQQLIDSSLQVQLLCLEAAVRRMVTEAREIDPATVKPYSQGTPVEFKEGYTRAVGKCPYEPTVIYTLNKEKK